MNVSFYCQEATPRHGDSERFVHRIQPNQNNCWSWTMNQPEAATIDAETQELLEPKKKTRNERKTDWKREVGLRVVKIRKSLKLTQNKFAEEIGILASRLRTYEEGSSKFPPDLAISLKEKTGFTTDYLYSGDTTQLPENRLSQLREAEQVMAKEEEENKPKRGRPKGDEG